MKRTARSRTTDIALLRIRIQESGLSDRQFAVKCLRRDERTIRRYLAGDVPMPAIIRELIRDPLVAPWPTKGTLPMLGS
tara:strand:+ start:572 stop:808 length:237 start_codon:yes stop_codon:yes gene_type:complete